MGKKHKKTSKGGEKEATNQGSQDARRDAVAGLCIFFCFTYLKLGAGETGNMGAPASIEKN